MRRLAPLFLVALTSSFLTLATTHRAAGTAPGQAAVVEDQSRGIVRIMIDGKEIAHFAADGLHVRDDIAYGGVITDVGRSNFGVRADGAP